MIEMGREYYRKAIDLLYAKSIGELEGVINMALAYVFHDKVYRIKAQLEDQYGKKTLHFVMTDESLDPPLELSLENGVGAGVRSVVSFVLHVYYLIHKNAYPILFLDEAYSQISEEYVERFFGFLKSFCAEKGFTVVLISHDVRFIPHADRTYSVVDGKVTEKKPA
jgi:ABC-type cobalamin transport system ATPase subunit